MLIQEVVTPTGFQMLYIDGKLEAHGNSDSEFIDGYIDGAFSVAERCDVNLYVQSWLVPFDNFSPPYRFEQLSKKGITRVG